MRRFAVVLAVSMAVPLVFMACGGGVGPDLAEFLGIWFGPGDDRTDTPFPVEVTMDGSGGISDYEIDGITETDAIPATFVVEDASSARITFDDMSEGGLFWDDAVDHLLFVDPIIDVFAVLEKNAAALPAYAASDAVGTWAGFAYVPDGAGDFDKESPVVLNVANDLSFSGTDPTNTPFTGSFNAALFDGTHGMYIGTVDGPPVEESIRIFLSPDMTFSGGILWEPDVTTVWPDDYIFLVLTKQ
jgi:hypothetical protein